MWHIRVTRKSSISTKSTLCTDRKYHFVSISALFAGILASFLAATGLLRYRDRKIAKKRSGLGFNDFVGYFSGEDIPLYNLRGVYSYFQNWQSVKDFPVSPADDLYKVYGIYDEDVDDAVIELANRWRVKLPPTFEGLRPVRTVADVVHLLNRLPPEE